MANAAAKNSASGNAASGKRIRTIAFIGMFSAIAAVLMFLDFPLPFAPSFYKFDFSEIPVLIGTFSFGPVAGVVMEFVKILVKTVIKGTSTAFVGELANFIMGCAFILPAGIIYRIKKNRKGAVIGLIAGTLLMTVVSCLVNAFVVLPAYATAFRMPIEELIKMGTAVNAGITDLFTFVVLAVGPFNLVKGVVVSFLTFLLYKRISRLIRSAGA